MNKQEFIALLAEETQLTKQQLEKVLKVTFGTITRVMGKQESINIPGFGSFTNKLRAACKGRNPSTGKEIDIPASFAAVFKASASLKEELNSKAS